MKKSRSENFVLIFVIIAGIVGLGLGLYSLLYVARTTGNIVLPASSIHWHTQLTIIVDGRQIPIPSGVGIDVGNNIDHHISGMRMAPIHTHDATGVLHIENRVPPKNLDALKIGYFINKVWGKRFDSKCLFDYCTNNGAVRMIVNGEDSNEFENYLMKDGDVIIITFK